MATRLWGTIASHHFEWIRYKMSVTFSMCYSELKSDVRERYDEKLTLIKASKNPYCL